jgi:DNA polymerase-4
MDAFYASVEQKDDPSLRGKPVIVGGDPFSRGVVCACSYEARKFGVRSAMPCSRAYKLCPEAIFIFPRFERYKQISGEIRSIFYEYTDLVEPLSLDEAYLDVTQNKFNQPFAIPIAHEIKQKIFLKTGLTASAGVSYNKFLAKVASDCNKPNGITVITPEEALAFIRTLPIGKFYGIGRVTEAKLIQKNICIGADLQKLSLDQLLEMFGKVGAYYYAIAHGDDPRHVEPYRERKSVGSETTFEKDIDSRNEMIIHLSSLAMEVADYLVAHNLFGKTVTLKVKYFDFTTSTRSLSLPQATQSAEVILKNIKELLKRTLADKKKVRLLGVSLSNLTRQADKNPVNGIQLELPF